MSRRSVGVKRPTHALFGFVEVVAERGAFVRGEVGPAVGGCHGGVELAVQFAATRRCRPLSPRVVKAVVGLRQPLAPRAMLILGVARGRRSPMASSRREIEVGNGKVSKHRLAL